jgi:hypothetical protein
MIRKLLLLSTFLGATLISQLAFSCANHFYVNTDNLGFVKGTVMRLAGLAAPKPTFELKHSPVAKATLGEISELVIEYDRPWFSRNAQIQLKSSKGIKLIDETAVLEDFNGVVKIRYSLEKSGFNNITIRVSGEYKGESVVSNSMVYVQARKVIIDTDKLAISSR